MNAGTKTRTLTNTALTWAASGWFGVAVIGQLLFVGYIAAFYGGALVQGNPKKWNGVGPHAYVDGDTVGNTAMGMHVLLSIVIMLAGLVQLLPQVRRLAPAFHRWNGRIYVSLALVSSVAGLYMVWIRGSVGDLVQHLGVSGAAVLIMLSAAMAVHHARARNFTLHRHWALRLFMVVSAVWFFRVGLMFSILVNKGPFGFNPETFTGPFLNFMSFGQYLVPLVILECYLRAKEGGSAIARMAMAACLLALTVAMAVGIFAASIILWLPRL